MFTLKLNKRLNKYFKLIFLLRLRLIHNRLSIINYLQQLFPSLFFL